MPFSDFSPFKQGSGKISPKRGTLPVQVGYGTTNPVGLGINDKGSLFYNTTSNELLSWNGTAWTSSGGGGNPFTYLQVGETLPAPINDGNNIYYYRFDGANLLLDEGDYSSNNLDDSEQGNIVQETSTLAPFYVDQITGNDDITKCLKTTGIVTGSTLLSGGCTFYLNFRTPSTPPASGEIIPLYIRSTQTGVDGFNNSGVLHMVGLFNDGVDYRAVYLSVSLDGLTYVTASAVVTDSTNYQLVVRQSTTGAITLATLNGSSMTTGSAGSGSSFDGWDLTDRISFLGSDYATFASMPFTVVSNTEASVDQALWRLAQDATPYVFDASFTGEVFITYFLANDTEIVANKYASFNDGAEINGNEFPYDLGTSGAALTTNGSGTLSWTLISLGVAYQNGRAISIYSGMPVVLGDRDTNEEYSQIPSIQVIDATDNACTISVAQNSGVFAFFNANLEKVHYATSVSFPNPNEVETSVNLASVNACIPGVNVKNDFPNVPLSIVILQNCDVVSDNGMYLLMSASNGNDTNSVATLLDVETGSPANITSTTGNAIITNVIYAEGYGHNGGAMQEFWMGPTLEAGNYGQIIRSSGNAPASLRATWNQDLSVPTIAVDYIKNDEPTLTAPMTKYDNAGDGADIQFTIRSTDPSTPSEGDHWYSQGRLKVQSNTGTETLVYSSDTDSIIASHATIQNIDATTTGQTLLYTVPSGRSFVMTGLYVYPTLVNAWTVSPQFGIGTAGGGYIEWSNGYIDISSLIGQTNIGKMFNGVYDSGTFDIYEFQSDDQIYIDINTAATASDLELRVSVIGYLI